MGVVRDLSLTDGDQFTLAGLNGAIDESELRAALDRAFRILGYHERSVSQMRKALRDDGYAQGSIERTIARLLELELLDDTRFASAYVRTKSCAGWGRRRVSQGLSHAGVSDEIADAALDAESPAEGQRDRARLLVRSFDSADPKARDRAIRRLVTRGFTWDDARAVVLESGSTDADDQ